MQPLSCSQRLSRAIASRRDLTHAPECFRDGRVWMPSDALDKRIRDKSFDGLEKVRGWGRENLTFLTSRPFSPETRRKAWEISDTKT